eukprot:1846324-Rhodomonas_salina.1
MAADFEHKGYAAVQRRRSYPSCMLHSALRQHNALAFIGFCMYMNIGVMCDTQMSQEFHANLYNTVTYSQEYDDSKDVNEALSRPDADFWWDATMSEYNSFIEMDVFEE